MGDKYIMYDCSKELNKFYRTHVVLSGTEQHELREKRKLNIDRLKEGLLEYNQENSTNYQIAENRIQGSMAMHTAVQNDKNDYDIDVGIVLESSVVADLGPRAMRNVIADALKRKTKQFAEAPEVKTSCVRLRYISKGYHVDFAVFKRYKKDEYNKEYTYEHAGSEWTVRHFKALEEWFNDQIDAKGKILRQVIRLSKMFCKSRDSWKNMPSGLIQTVLCDENLDTTHSRIDEVFYNTMSAIVKRLNKSTDVFAPIDNGRSLVTRDIDRQRINNWKNKLESYLKELDILFKPECTIDDAIGAWKNFFNHQYWEELYENIHKEHINGKKVQGFVDTEEFIDDKYRIDERYYVVIDCKVSAKGFSPIPISKYLENRAQYDKYIPHNFSIRCKIGNTDCHSYDKVLWKVLNVGDEAERRNDIRGQIRYRGKEITEYSRFFGHHYIECYLIKENRCVAIGHVNIPIGWS